MGASALVVFVPEADLRVADLRLQHDPSALQGVAAHVTVLFPFVDHALVDEALLGALHSTLGCLPRFRFDLNTVGRFPGVCHLAPDPASGFLALTQAVHQRFPAFPPYGGLHRETVPHLTVAHGAESACVAAASELAERLQRDGPIGAECRAVHLIAPADGRWQRLHAFELAAPIVSGTGGGHP